MCFYGPMAFTFDLNLNKVFFMSPLYHLFSAAMCGKYIYIYICIFTHVFET